jgi:protoheme IX farnesyltransferase
MSIPANAPWNAAHWQHFIAGNIGIALFAGAAAMLNCLIEEKIDALMARTRARPLPRGQVGRHLTLVVALLVATVGAAILARWVNLLTMWLTMATFIGYAIIYTVFLKPNTPQNIVIGGASGAMPPVLGWAAMTGTLSAEAWILFLIIFVWTPPHFWALALYRRTEYARAGLPMLPVTHGERFTQLHILLYTIVLIAMTLLPLAIKNMSGWIYAMAMCGLNIGFLTYNVRLYHQYSDALARSAFKFSSLYLSLLFAAFLIDHYWYFPL